ncbi:MAG: gliding motility-associated C-terminal domain-containing protein [Flavobacterium sp.]|nr:gliding motility-associated C-terminal domain-containing protein [Flavobacterium sp.]
MTIVVNPKPTPIFSQVAAICEGNALASLPTISSNGISGVWSPAINNTVTTTYTFTPSDVCALLVPMTITVTPRISPVFSLADAICFADSQFELPTTSSNGITGSWSPSLNNTQTATYVFTPNATECAVPTSKELVVFDDFDFEHIRYCQNGELFLEILPTLQSFDSNSAQYDWQLNNITIANNAILNVTSYLKSTSINETMPITFDITVTNSDGCPKQRPTLQSVYCEIQKGISPNNDGLNEFFDLRLLDVEKLVIFNRYGTKVYSRNNYTEEGTVKMIMEICFQMRPIIM